MSDPLVEASRRAHEQVRAMLDAPPAKIVRDCENTMGKPGDSRERHQMVWALSGAGCSAEKLGKLLGVSRQRVRQMAAKRDRVLEYWASHPWALLDAGEREPAWMKRLADAGAIPRRPPPAKIADMDARITDYWRRQEAEKEHERQMREIAITGARERLKRAEARLDQAVEAVNRARLALCELENAKDDS